MRLGRQSAGSEFCGLPSFPLRDRLVSNRRVQFERNRRRVLRRRDRKLHAKRRAHTLPVSTGARAVLSVTKDARRGVFRSMVFRAAERSPLRRRHHNRCLCRTNNLERCH